MPSDMIGSSCADSILLTALEIFAIRSRLAVRLKQWQRDLRATHRRAAQLAVAIEADPSSVFDDAELLSYGSVIFYLSTTVATPSVCSGCDRFIRAWLRGRERGRA